MRMLILAEIVAVVFFVFVLVFAASAEPAQVRNLPKWAWLVIVVFFPVVGAIAYLIFGRPLSAGSAGSSGASEFRFRSQTPKPRTGPIAPDDDPEFLRELDRRLRSEPKDQAEPKPKPSEETQEGDETGKAE